MKITSFPSREMLRKRMASVPPYMRPNDIPFAVCGEGVLTPGQCDAIRAEMMTVDPHSFPGCNAKTRECPYPLTRVFDPIVQFTKFINDTIFGYDIDDDAAAFFQTYEEGDYYQIHMDATPAHMRKLTAVTMINDETKYEGGRLTIHFHPNFFDVPRTQGTIVVFQPWLLHEVQKVTSGVRQTVNLGFWGPNFR